MMAMEKDPLLKPAGEVALLMGNEAIARGAIEAGVCVASTYPGTPSSEIADTLSRIAAKLGIYMEYSTNEKVAMEVAGSAAIAGLKSMVSMKHVGLNVAADPFMSLAYTGVRAGMVIVTADDPECFSSQNEQDNRIYSILSGMPMIEPSNPQEAKDYTVLAFKISEKLKLPVILRTTTRISHCRMNVKLGEIKSKGYEKQTFKKSMQELVLLPANARVLHRRLLQKLKEARKISEAFPGTKVVGEENDIGIISSGAAFNYAMEAVKATSEKIPVLKIGMTNPLPEETILDFLENKKLVIVVEELSPFLENYVKKLIAEFKLDVEVHGKDVIPEYGELNPSIVYEALAKIIGKPVKINLKTIENVPRRPPVMCPGCPHRSVFYIVRKVLGDKAIYPTDIGCYTLGALPPYMAGDLLFCMGSSIGTSSGLSKAIKEPIVAFIGDSTFYHAGIPALINSIYNKAEFILFVLDNRTTAMTGHQPHPGTGITGLGERTSEVKISNIVKGCGVKYVKTVDPYDLRTLEETFRDALNASGVRVIIARRECALLSVRRKIKEGKQIKPYRVDKEKCRGCMLCVKQFACPAITVKDGKAHINERLCVGCGVCAQVCPFNAIGEVK